MAIKTYKTKKCTVFLWSSAENISKNIDLLKELDFHYKYCHTWFNENYPNEAYYLIAAQNYPTNVYYPEYSPVIFEKSEVNTPPECLYHQLHNKVENKNKLIIMIQDLPA